MAVARKCDRCGQLYELPKVGELCGFAWLMGYDEEGCKFRDKPHTEESHKALL